METSETQEPSLRHPNTIESAVSDIEVAKLQEQLERAQKQLEEMPERTSAMQNMIGRLNDTVLQLKNDMSQERQEKSKILADLDQTQKIALEAKSLIELVKTKDSHASWKERVEAELKFTGGYCTDVALHISRELESVVRDMHSAYAAPDQWETPTFRQRLKMLKENNILTHTELNRIYEAWLIRNKLAHENKTRATAAQGYLMVAALEILLSKNTQS